MRYQQQGVSLISMLFWGAMAVFGFIVGSQVVGAEIEFQAITKVANKAAKGATVAEIRSIFDTASVNHTITSLAGKDLEVIKENDKTVVIFAYGREIHLAGPVYLLLKYNGRSN